MIHQNVLANKAERTATCLQKMPPGQKSRMNKELLEHQAFHEFDRDLNPFTSHT